MSMPARLRERRERLRSAVSHHTATLTRDELVELTYALAAMLEWPFKHRCGGVM